MTVMEEESIEPDAPSSKATAAVNIAAGQEDSGDEDAPDYTQLTALAAKAQRRIVGGGGGSAAADDTIVPFIPKRGEKDFEPTGFEAQARALEKSRKAMFDVIKCERVVSSKTISVATWEPCLKRAIVELARGTVFSSIGSTRRVKVLKDGLDEDLERMYNPCRVDWERDGVYKEGVFYERTRPRVELLPEEALYLVERGSLECRVRPRKASKPSLKDELKDYDADGTWSKDWIPMSVQHAFATMLFSDGLTRERYQLYAYLRRLGYVVQRKSTYDEIHALAALKRIKSHTGNTSEIESIVADPQHPLKLVTFFDVLLYPLRRISQIVTRGVRSTIVGLSSSLQWLRRLPHRSTISRAQQGISRGLLGLGGIQWDRYEQIFDRLQIVPSGHTKPVARKRTSQKNDQVPEIFYYAWRPATRYKKTDPPLPEYRIAIVDARKTTLPSVYAFETLFQGVPIPLNSQDLDDLDEDERKEWERAQEEKKRNDESYGKGAVRKTKAGKAAAERIKSDANRSQAGIYVDLQHYLISAYHRLLRFVYFVNHCFTMLPPGCASIRNNNNNHRQGINSRPRPTNVFVPLKAGRRNVIVAVNDCGTTSLLRFGEAEFERWKLAGSDAP